ncbi:hypothetical protein [Streptomyces sp. C10]|uniref:hypothetical protein n=1 Tax=Streptomyces sp. C10 TaxID=531941 RepID=UPI00397F11E9
MGSIELTGRVPQGTGLRLRAVGNEFAARLAETVHRLTFDNRDTPIDRAHHEEEDLARLLLAAPLVPDLRPHTDRLPWAALKEKSEE